MLPELLGVITPANDLFDELLNSGMRETFCKAQNKYANLCLEFVGFMTIEQMKYIFHLPIELDDDLVGIAYAGPRFLLNFNIVPGFSKDGKIFAMAVTVEYNED